MSARVMLSTRDGTSGGATASAMEVRAQVARLRDDLTRVRTVRMALVALAWALGALVLWHAAVLLFTTPNVRLPVPLPWALATLVGVAAYAVQVSRTTPITDVRAALWYEEQHPRGHAVVTLVDCGHDALDVVLAERLAAQARMPAGAVRVAADALRTTSREAWQSPAMLVMLGAVLAFSVMWLGASAVRAGSTTASTSRALDAAAGSASRTARLSGWRVEVTPPAYAARPAIVWDDSSTVQALVGSRVRVSGAGEADGLVAAWVPREGASGDTVAVTQAEARWSATVVMPSRASALRLVNGTEERVLTLIPRPDSLPVVQLLAPLRDSVYRDSVGELILEAEARDDLGLASVQFELIVTSGAGEQYTARTQVVGRRDAAGSVRAAIRERITFASLRLAPGDVVHMRAVARDRHPAAAREAGVSETRSLRIARADEYDSVAVDAAPPPAIDSSMLSQRMLLVLTERLEARRPRISREVLVSESRKLGAEQARIRRAVSAIVFQRLSGEDPGEHAHSEGDGHDHGLTLLEGKLVPSTGSPAVNVMPGATAPPPASDMVSGEAPIVGINRPLLEAYNAMWDAGRALELADPAAAIPPMRLALDAIQRARAAERVYLRGRTRPVVVDLARVRLSGRDTGQASVRRPGTALERIAAVYDARLLRAAALLDTDAAAARDSLLTLRLDAIDRHPAFAGALALALDALTRGREPTDALVRARRALAMPARSVGVAPWSVP
jgi:hypothetical protein